MYVVRFNETLRDNKIIDETEIRYVSPVRKNIIKQGDEASLFSSKINKNYWEEKTDIIFHAVVLELFIYTSNGELILTLDDIKEEMFSYTFPGLRLVSIIINEEIINAGKEKYSNEARVEYNDFQLTYFDGIEFYDCHFWEPFSINYLFSNDIWGVGINSIDIKFIFLKYFHYGFNLLDIDFIFSANNSKESSVFFNLVVPNVGFHYSFHDNFRVTASGLVKLGFEVSTDIHENVFCSFLVSPGFSVGFLLFDFIGLKYTGMLTKRYGYINEISISFFVDWFTSYKYIN